jgi:uncharacterized protein YcbK (DUF882 family)
MAVTLVVAAGAHAQSALPASRLATASVGAESAPAAPAARTELATRLFGRSGALRVAVLQRADALDPTFAEAVGVLAGQRYRWVPLHGGDDGLAGVPAFAGELSAPGAPGTWRLETDHEASPFLTVISQVPFAAKRGAMLNGYHVGRYPTEGSGRSDAYAPPAGFIEVTREGQELHVSEHFRLRQFLTKDQASVWPKYVALRMELIDKLELVLQELNRMGVRADRMYVMSGYRTPQYNGPGGDGRAALSRHMYGDAADVWVDNDGDAYMDDLNGDGLRDPRDAEVMLRAVERVEQKYPELVGGAGVYAANSAHGPFIHVDVRGERSRW